MRHGVTETMAVMGRYYLTHQAAYFDLLGSVIGMMAAIFTVTWMQKNNEHLAMLSAGISTHRAIRPVIFCSVVVSMLSVVNQEIIIPRNAEEIQKSHADDGVKKVDVSSRYDSRGVMIDGKEADRASRTIVTRFNATILPEVFGVAHKLEAKQATYISARGGADTASGRVAGSRRRAHAASRAGTSGTRRVDLDQGQEHGGFPAPLRRPGLAEGRHLFSSDDSLIQVDDAKTRMESICINGRTGGRPG